MSQRHVYHEGNRVLCGLPFANAREGTIVGDPGAGELCPTCAARDAAARLGGFKWVTCTGCRGSGSVARLDSAVTSCFQCGNAGLMPSRLLQKGWCSCGHWESKHDEHAGCLEGGCPCQRYDSTA